MVIRKKAVSRKGINLFRKRLTGIPFNVRQNFYLDDGLVAIVKLKELPDDRMVLNGWLWRLERAAWKLGVNAVVVKSPMGKTIAVFEGFDGFAPNSKLIREVRV